MSGQQHVVGVYRVLSYAFRVQTDLTPVAEIVERTFGAFRTPGDEAARTYRLRGDGKGSRLVVDGELLMEASPARLVDHLLWHVYSHAYGDCTELLLVHAGVVARDGSAILLPGASGSGKTTLTAGLVAAGCDYLSDEVAAIDPGTTRVLPVPTALSVKEGSLTVLGLGEDATVGITALLPDGRPVPPTVLREDPLGGPAPVGAVITPRFESGATTELRACSRATGLFDLATNGFNLPSFGGAGFRLLARLVRPTRCYRLQLGDLEEAVAAVLAATEEAAPQPA